MRYINSLPRPLLFKKGNGSAGRFLRKVHLIYVNFPLLLIKIRECFIKGFFIVRQCVYIAHMAGLSRDDPYNHRHDNRRGSETERRKLSFTKRHHNQEDNLRDHGESRQPGLSFLYTRFQAGLRIVASLLEPFSEYQLRSANSYPGKCSCESG